MSNEREQKLQESLTALANAITRAKQVFNFGDDVTITDLLHQCCDTHEAALQSQLQEAEIARDSVHDAFYNTATLEYTETVCSDKNCEFCKNRPSKFEMPSTDAKDALERAAKICDRNYLAWKKETYDDVGSASTGALVCARDIRKAMQSQLQEPFAWMSGDNDDLTSAKTKEELIGYGCKEKDCFPVYAHPSTDKDAERYRWLRDLDFKKPYGVTNSKMDEIFNGDELDEAIDKEIEIKLDK